MDVRLNQAQATHDAKVEEFKAEANAKRDHKIVEGAAADHQRIRRRIRKKSFDKIAVQAHLSFEAHMDTSEEPFDGELTGTMPRPRCELRVVCEPAQFEMHMDMSSRKSPGEVPGTTGVRPAVDGSCEPLGLDDVSFFRCGMVLCLPLHRYVGFQA